MDSVQWHQQARSLQTGKDCPPLPPGELAASTPEIRRRYAARVRRHLRHQRLDSPRHHAVMDDLSGALEEIEDEPPGARTILSLSAPFTTGKSSLIKDWAQALYRDWAPGPLTDDLPERTDASGTRCDLTPVVYVSLKSRSTAKDVYGGLLTFLGYPSRGTISEVTLRTITALRDHDVRLVVVDDAHFLHTSSIVGREALDALKQINTELGELEGTLVLVGANLTDGPALNDPQIRGRLWDHQMGPYTLASRDDRAQWQELLGRAEPRVQRYLPDLPTDELATRLAAPIYKRTQGFIGDVGHLLAGATHRALNAGRTTLERTDLEGVRLSRRAHDGQDLIAAAREEKAPRLDAREAS